MSALPRLMWIVDSGAWAVERRPARAVAAGVRLLQLRDDQVTPRDWRAQVERWAGAAEALRVVVNQGPEWAAQHGWGAHLKASQPPLDANARARFGLLGCSVHDRAELTRALRNRPDYLVAGPLFPTASKAGHPGIGIAGFAALVQAARGCPVFAVGGIVPTAVAALVACGAHGIAVRSGISTEADPEVAVAAYLAALAQACELPVDSHKT